MSTIHLPSRFCSQPSSQPPSSARRSLTGPARSVADRLGAALPAELREEAIAMDWNRFRSTYAPAGAIRLGAWDAHPAARDRVDCRGTFAVGDAITSLHVCASGQISAMTSMLHELGAPVEIVSLHQSQTDDQVVTFLMCERDDQRCWAAGFGETSDEANVNALVAGANRLLPRA